MKDAKILVVDDDPPIADMLVMVLEDEGYAVQTAHDGETALATVQRGPPDLVVTDVMMPGTSGIAVARHLRSRGIPVILMSAAVRYPDLPDVPFIAKPFAVDRFLGMVARALTA